MSRHADRALAAKWLTRDLDTKYGNLAGFAFLDTWQRL